VFVQHTGWRQKDVVGQFIFDLFPEIRHRNKDQYLKDCVEKGRSAILSPLVHHHFIDLTLIKGERRLQMTQEAKLFPLWEADELLGAIIIIRDFTEQIEHEAGLVEKTRAFNALRNINRMMVRVDTREAVFSQSVNILARDMGLSLVWFAHVHGGADDVVIGDYDGIEKERFKTFLCDHSGDHRTLVRRLELTHQAVKTGSLQVTYRREHPPEMGRWWDLFQAGGCTVAVAVPLCVEGRITAVLHIHIREKLQLPQDILQLLQELADDIALALKNFHDVAVRHEAELKTQAEKERLLVTLKGIGDAVLVCDAHGKVVLMNPVAESLTGWREEDAVGKPAATVFSIINETSRKPCPCPVDQVIATGKVIGLSNNTLLLSRSDCEYPIADSAAPIRNGSGGLVGVVLIFRDVTERRSAEKALQISEKRFRDITMSMGDLVWEFDENGIFTYMGSSVEHVLGYDRREFLGRPFWDFTFREHDDGDQEMDLKAAFLKNHGEKRPFFNLETRAQDRAGQWRLLLTNGIPVMDDAGTLMGYRGVTRDITEHKNAEADKIRAEMLENLIESIPDMVVTNDVNGRITGFNSVARDIIGLGEEDLDKMPTEFVVNEDRPKVERTIKECQEKRNM